MLHSEINSSKFPVAFSDLIFLNNKYRKKSDITVLGFYVQLKTLKKYLCVDFKATEI